MHKLPEIPAFLACLILTLAVSCSKEAEPSRTPSIRLLDISRDSLREFKDSLVIRFEYTDADGDIGEDNPDKNDLMIKDRRLSNADFYFVKPLAPPGSGIKITGIIAVQIKNTFLLGTGSAEQTVFDIKLRDRAGNWSNNISTPSITIIR